MKPIESLLGNSRWLLAPTVPAVVAGVAVSATYALVTLSMSATQAFRLTAVATAVSGSLLLIGLAVAQDRLRPLSRLAEGLLPPSPRHLDEAARAVLAAPDVSFSATLFFFSGGAALSSLIWQQWTRVDSTTALRMGLIAVTVAPVSAVLANLLMLPRGRVVLDRLLKLGLEPSRLLEGQPPRLELGRRLGFFAGVAVLAPFVLVVDLSLARSRELSRALAAAGEKGAAEVLANASGASSLLPVVLLGGLVLVMVLGASWLAGDAIGVPLSALARHTERVAAGAPDAKDIVAAEHETFNAALALATLEKSLTEVAERVAGASHGIGAATQDLAHGVSKQEKGAAQQSAALAETTATTEELARSARQIATNASRVADLARRALESATSGKGAASAFAVSMRHVREGHQAIADAVVRLNKRVQQVSRIVGFIDGINDRSELLALNAELEGNKAGEVGRGFSLVAAEMRRLSESVMESTREIGRLLNDIRDATNAAVMATEAGVKASDLGANLAQSASEALERIVTFSQQTSDAMQSVNMATLQQQSGTDQLVQAMSGILTSTKSGVEASGQIGTTNQQLEALSKALDGATARLRGGS